MKAASPSAHKPPVPRLNPPRLLPLHSLELNLAHRSHRSCQLFSLRSLLPYPSPSMSIVCERRATAALPCGYWIIFGLYEPMLSISGFVGALADPKKVSTTASLYRTMTHTISIKAHDAQAPWPSGSAPPDPLARATQVTMLQLAHVVGLLGLINFFVLGAARKYLFAQPVLQEKIVGALLTPLLIADVVHLSITWWALGDSRWQFWEWSGLLWITFLTGFSLLIPRAAWHLGVGRYVDRRDGQAYRKA